MLYRIGFRPFRFTVQSREDLMLNLPRLSPKFVGSLFSGILVFLFFHPVQAQLLELKSWEYDPSLEGKKAGYFNAFRAGNIDPDREGLEAFLDKFYFARWTALEDLGEGQMVSAGLAQLGARELIQDFRGVSGAARTYLLEKSFQTLQKMAADPVVHPAARVNAVLAIGQLAQQESSGTRNPPVLYAPALPYLIAEYQKADSPQYVKLAALNGIVRHAGAGIADETMKNETVPNLCLKIIADGKPGQEVDREEQDTKDWFRQTAMDALARLRSVGTGGSTVNALVLLLGDGSETLEIRTKAARTLGDLDYQAASALGTNLNYQLIGTSLITLMKTVCDSELQTVIQLRDKARVSQGGAMGAAMPTGPGVVENDPPYSSTMTPEAKIDIAGAVQSIKSNVQNVVYGLRGLRFTGRPEQGIQPMLPEDDAVVQNINAVMTKGVNPLFKLLDEGPPESELQNRNAMTSGMGAMPPESMMGPTGRSRPQAPEEKILKVNLLNIRDALQLFSTELEGIISGTGT